MMKKDDDDVDVDERENDANVLGQDVHWSRSYLRYHFCKVS